MNRTGRNLLVALIASAMLAGCSPGGGYQRGIFTGYVVDSTEEEIVSKIGKPDRIDAADPSAPKWVYNKKTFDPDNQNMPITSRSRHAPAVWDISAAFGRPAGVI